MAAESLPRSTSLKAYDPAQKTAVALKAYGRIVELWGLKLREAAQLVDMSESTWKRARRPGYSGALGKDQMLRISALVGLFKSLELYFSEPIAREWIKLVNEGPEFEGMRPLDAMISGGLPKIIRVRAYIDALRGGV